MKVFHHEISDLLAAEYVLGTLQGAARRRFINLLLCDRRLQQQVENWDLCINRLAEKAIPITPPVSTWTALERRLFTSSQPTGRSSRLSVWRRLAFASTLLAVGLATLLLTIEVRETPAYVALVTDETQVPLWLVSVSTDRNWLSVENRTLPTLPPGKRCLLWLRPQGSETVYPLGVLPDQGETVRLAIDPVLRTRLPGKLLVTVEDKSDTLPLVPTDTTRYQGIWIPIIKR